MDTLILTPAALRTQRCRDRKRRGAIVLSLQIDAPELDTLIRLGWLTEEERADHDAVLGALSAFAARGFAERVTPLR